MWGTECPLSVKCAPEGMVRGVIAPVLPVRGSAEREGGRVRPCMGILGRKKSKILWKKGCTKWCLRVGCDSGRWLSRW